MPNMADGKSYTVFNKEYNWKSLYGKLKSGEYQFTLSTDGMFSINIAFTIKSNGTVSFEKPELK